MKLADTMLLRSTGKAPILLMRQHQIFLSHALRIRMAFRFSLRE